MLVVLNAMICLVNNYCNIFYVIFGINTFFGLLYANNKCIGFVVNIINYKLPLIARL